MSAKILNTLLIGAVLAGLTLATYYADNHAGRNGPTPSAPTHNEPAAASTPAPAVVFKTPEGRNVALHDFRGRVVLLYFWASWCAPCIADFPAKTALAQRMGKRLAVLAVSVDADKAAIERFMNRYGRAARGLDNFIVLHDPGKDIVQDVFHTLRLPETIIIDPAMNMREKVAGAARDWVAPETQSRLEALIPAP